ncbi:MAG: dephospho-CoA kinase, partial [Rhodospirillales bacterium]
RVFDDDAALKRLEAILHPLVRRSEKNFLAGCARRRVPLVVLDIPLLFETGGDARCDAVLVVHCRPALQRRRVLARPGMTEKKFEAILARQVPAAEKVQLADFTVDTGIGRHAALMDLKRAVTLLHTCKGRVWAPSSYW